MKIKSHDDKQWIEIEQSLDVGYPSYKFQVSIDIGHNLFTGENNDMYFLNLEEFIGNLDSFILNREIKPKLEGTYNCFVEFYRPGNKNIIMVSFYVGSTYAGFSDTASYGLKGCFEFNAEYLNEVLEGFKEFQENA
jgi:hypothetical protein